MSEISRELKWLGPMRWGDAVVSALDPNLNRALLDNITARIAVIGRDHCYQYANREMLDFVGLSPEQVIGHHLSEIVGTDMYAGYAYVAERLFTGEGLSIEGWVDYPTRGRRYLTEMFVPYGPPGKPIESIAVFGRDHTELKLREQELASKLEELKASEALKSAIVDHALVAIISTDAHGRIVEFNPAAEAMFGRTRAAVLGLAVSAVVMPERFRSAHEAGMQRLAGGGDARVLGKRMELHALRADGTEFPIEMVLWRTRVGRTDFYTASMVDVTERHSAALQIERQREELRQGEKLTAMGSLLAGVAHELNNPLAIVMGRASLLEEKCSDPALIADVQSIRAAAERCGRILRTFLNMARSRPSQRSAVALNEVVQAATDMLHYGLRTHGIELQLQLDPALPPVLADGDQIGQVVLNLLVNAQQALAATEGRAPRFVRVQSGTERDAATGNLHAWLRIMDNGAGVASDLRMRIFDPFFTTKTEGMGTGLGLAVSRSLAREHGGELLLEPDHAGSGGASFRLSLPVGGVSSDALPAALLPPSDAPALSRLLVVDDEVELADLMREMLEAAGYEVATAESGAVALELLDIARFDAIVSDLRMPDMGGPELWREVQARHPQLAMRLLFITGDTLSTGARQFLADNRCAVLDKPFTKNELLAHVATLLI